jgi:hypothetical protein
MESLLGQRTSASAASIPLTRGVTERRDLLKKKAGTRRTDRSGYAKAAVMDALRARTANRGERPLVQLETIQKLWWDWLERELYN